MSWRLKKGPFPPDGFPFTDARTSYKFDGMSADPIRQVRMIIAHRQANSRLYPSQQNQHFSFESVMQELLEQICSRYPSYCTKDGQSSVTRGDMIIEAPQKSIQAACPKCGGTEFNVRYCTTCSGRRVVGWTCAKCGAQR